MRRIAIVLLMLGLSTFASRAEAQPVPWAPERLSAGWTFMPAITFGALWDDNVTVQNAGGTGANATIREWVGVVSPRGELVYNGRQTRFNAGYAGALEHYRRLDQLNRYEQRGRMSLRHRVNRRLELTSMGSVTRTPTSDRLELGAIPFVRVGSRLIEAAAAASVTLSQRTSLDAAYRFQDVHFERSEAEVPAFLSGGFAHMPSLSVMRTFTSRLGAGATYEFRRAETAGGTSAFNSQSALADVRYRLSDSTSFSAAAGVAFLDIADQPVNEWGPAFRASLEHQQGLTRVSARYERAFLPSFSFGGLAGNQFASLSATTPLTRAGRLTLNGTGAFSRTEPVESLPFTFQLNTYWVSGGLGYQVSRWLRAETFVSTTLQKSSAQGDVDRTRIGIQFTTSKPMRIQ